MFRADASQIVTYAPDTTDPRWLGQLGHVSALNYSYAMPGGADQLSATFERPATTRYRAIESGRFVCVYRGALRIWEGVLDEPAPSDAGWSITAHGVGTYGANFMAKYSTWNADDPVNQAITNRGLRWVNSGLAASSPYTGQQTDDATVSLTDHLNNISGPAALTWYVRTGPSVNTLSMFALPSAPTRILLATTPALRTLHGYFTRIWARYESSADGGSGAAVYSVTSVENTANRLRHGSLETSADLSQGGVLSAAAAQAIITKLLAKYQAATFAGPFTIRPGQYLNMGGQPVDLGAEEAGEVVLLSLAAGGYGGELVPVLPVTFAVGGYAFDDASGTAQVTPFVAVSSDFAGLLSNYTTTHPAPA